MQLIRRSFYRGLEVFGHQVSLIGAWLTIKSSRPYHPLGDRQQAKLQRPNKAFEQRWDYVSQALGSCQARSFLDLGCAEGYYVRRAALEHGVFAIGIDKSPRRLRQANALALLENDSRCSFLDMEINSASISRLPVFDVVSCMSLLHHVIHHQGISEARALMRAISERTGKYMLFDMGGPGESSNVWAPSLSEFSGNVPANIAFFLKECGFDRVEVIGTSMGYGEPVEREFFIAEPTQNENEPS